MQSLVRQDLQMTEMLRPDGLMTWLSRFSNFGDAVIRCLTIGEDSAMHDRAATVVVDVQDREASGKWVRVTMTIEGLSEFRVIQGPGDYFVIFDLDVRIAEDMAEVSQDDGAWYIRGKQLRWAVSSTDGYAAT